MRAGSAVFHAPTAVLPHFKQEACTKRYTLDQIRGSYNPKADEDSVIYRRILRPISFYLTFAMLRIGITKPNQATFVSFLFGMMACALFITGHREAFCIGVLFYILSIISDYVDGNIARVTDSATYYGKFLDGAVDVIITTSMPLSIAVGHYRACGRMSLLYAGMAVSIAWLIGFFIANRVSFYAYLVKADELSGVIKNRIASPNIFKSRGMLLRKILNINADVMLVLLLAASLTGMTNMILSVILLSFTACASSIIFVSVSKASADLNVHKVSKLALSQKEGMGKG